MNESDMHSEGKGKDVDGPPLISIVFSFRNEEDVLRELIRRVDTALSDQPLTYELIFVNDDSLDASLEVLIDERTRNPGVKIINTSRCFGGPQCLKAGMAYASGDAVITMDADLQDPPEVLPEMLDKWRDGAEVVYTVRERREGEPAFRLMITKIAYKIINRSSRLFLPVEAGDFRLMSKRAAKKFVKLDESIPYSRGLAMWVGFKRAPVYYVRAARLAGKSGFPGTFSFGALQSFVAGITSFSMVPLFFILVVGLIATAVSAAGLVAALFGAPFPEGTAMVLFMVLLWGSLMASLGVVAVYISRIYSDVRGRPGYIVKDTIGLEAMDD